MQDSFTTKITFASPDETTRFAAALAPLLKAGDTILLEGSIGAGKSHFARGIIQARLAAVNRLEDVPSPTFTLVQTYDDTISEIWHTDLYRLTGPADIDDLGLWDAFETAICLVEWPDRLGALAPDTALTLLFEPTDTPGHRVATFHSNSPLWQIKLHEAGLK